MKKSISLIIVAIMTFVTLTSNIALASNLPTKNIKNVLYSIQVPTWAKVLSTTEKGDYSTVLSDNDLSFTAKISFESISDSDLVDVRRYLDDYSSNGFGLFDSIIDLKASAYEAVEKSYENSALFYPLNKDYSEYNFKIIDKQIQNLFGTRTFSIMYNTLDATLNNISEFSKIDIYIPSYNNGGIFSLNFIVPREQMNINTSLKFAELIASIKLTDHLIEDRVPLIFVANGNTEKSAAGIYPAFTFKNYNMKPFYRKEMGLSFYYPDFLIPTDEVTNFDGIQSASFKIDPYTTLNVTVADSNLYSLNDSIASTLTSIYENTNISEMNKLESPNGEIFEIKYSYFVNDVNYKKTSYSMSSNGSTVIYSFITSAQNPAYSIDNIAIRVLMTTKIFERSQESSVSSVTYLEKKFGEMILKLPDEYKVQNLGENNMKITSPDVNTFKIYLLENELTKNLDFEAVSKLTNGDYPVFDKYLKNSFTLPYISIQSTNLGGSFVFNDKTSKIYRIKKYLDENNRIHYCYSVSISRNEKLYTMLIDINSLLYREDGKVGQTMPIILNEIANSFKLCDLEK